jgi:hypothetical protein
MPWHNSLCDVFRAAGARARPLLKTRQSSISINGEAHNTRAQWQTLRLITGNFAIQFPPTGARRQRRRRAIEKHKSRVSGNRRGACGSNHANVRSPTHNELDKAQTIIISHSAPWFAFAFAHTTKRKCATTPSLFTHITYKEKTVKRRRAALVQARKIVCRLPREHFSNAPRAASITLRRVANANYPIFSAEQSPITSQSSWQGIVCFIPEKQQFSSKRAMRSCKFIESWQRSLIRD